MLSIGSANLGQLNQYFIKPEDRNRRVRKYRRKCREFGVY